MGDYSVPDNDAADITVSSGNYTAASNDTVTLLPQRESSVSDEVTATTVLPAPASVTGSYSQSSEDITITWTKTDDSTDGSVTIQRRTDSTNDWQTRATGLSPTTTSYTDTNIPDVQDIEYRVRRLTDHETASTTTTVGLPPNPATLNDYQFNRDATVTLTWQDNSGGTASVDVYRASQPSENISDYTKVASLTAGTVSHDISYTGEDSVYVRVVAINDVGATVSNMLAFQPQATVQTTTDTTRIASANGPFQIT